MPFTFAAVLCNDSLIERATKTSHACWSFQLTVIRSNFKYLFRNSLPMHRRFQAFHRQCETPRMAQSAAERSPTYHTRVVSLRVVHAGVRHIAVHLKHHRAISRHRPGQPRELAESNCGGEVRGPLKWSLFCSEIEHGVHLRSEATVRGVRRDVSQ